MKTAQLFKLVGQSIRRSKRDFVLSSFGIIMGIATLLFFTALGAGVRTTVLERVFIVRQLEVVKPAFDGLSLGLFGEKKLNEQTVASLRQIPGVAEVFPKMKLVFPSSVKGGAQLLGRDMMAEMVGDGIPPELVKDEVTGGLAFKDWENVACTADAECGSGFGCVGGVCAGKACEPSDIAACGAPAYCHETEKVCQMPIPVLVSPSLLEIYNGSLHTALGGAKGAMSKMPKLSAAGLVGFQFEGVFGRSFLGTAKSNKQLTRRMQLVGFSDKAINLGVTMPIGYVQRLNALVAGEAGGGQYHSIIVEAHSNDVIPQVAQGITNIGLALSSKYEDAQRAGLLIMLITLIFNLVSLLFLGIAAINIMHTFLMMILERRRELALMRAVGATPGDIRMMVLGEATALALVGSTIGMGVGYGASLVVDFLLKTQVPAFPYKPETLFALEAWMFGMCLAVALVFCWLGALAPAFRASRMDPAAALAGR